MRFYQYLVNTYTTIHSLNDKYNEEKNSVPFYINVPYTGRF